MYNLISFEFHNCHKRIVKEQSHPKIFSQILFIKRSLSFPKHNRVTSASRPLYQISNIKFAFWLANICDFMSVFFPARNVFFALLKQILILKCQKSFFLESRQIIQQLFWVQIIKICSAIKKPQKVTITRLSSVSQIVLIKNKLIFDDICIKN